jgi:hypothetical protein
MFESKSASVISHASFDASSNPAPSEELTYDHERPVEVEYGERHSFERGTLLSKGLYDISVCNAGEC